MRNAIYLLGLMVAFGAFLPAQAGLVISYDMDGFTGPVTTIGGATLVNGGTYGASGNGSVDALNGGSVTATTGSGGAGDTALELNDANAAAGTLNKGGGVKFALPVITADWSYGFSVRRDGDQAQYDKVVGLGNGSATEATDVQFSDADTLTIGVGGRNFNYDLLDSTWTHIFVTYDNDGGSNPSTQGKMTVYINGVDQLFSQGIFVDNTKDNLSEVDGEVKSLGYQTSNYYRPFNGALDNFVVYDEILSAADVLAIYEATQSPQSSVNVILLGGIR